MEQRHEVSEQFIVQWEFKGKTGEYDRTPDKEFAISRADDLRVSEVALQNGTKYGVIKRTVITLEEVIEPVRAAGWVEGLNEEIKTNRK